MNHISVHKPLSSPKIYEQSQKLMSVRLTQIQKKILSRLQQSLAEDQKIIVKRIFYENIDKFNNMKDKIQYLMNILNDVDQNRLNKYLIMNSKANKQKQNQKHNRNQYYYQNKKYNIHNRKTQTSLLQQQQQNQHYNYNQFQLLNQQNSQSCPLQSHLQLSQQKHLNNNQFNQFSNKCIQKQYNKKLIDTDNLLQSNQIYKSLKDLQLQKSLNRIKQNMLMKKKYIISNGNKRNIQDMSNNNNNNNNNNINNQYLDNNDNRYHTVSIQQTDKYSGPYQKYLPSQRQQFNHYNKYNKQSSHHLNKHNSLVNLQQQSQSQIKQSDDFYSFRNKNNHQNNIKDNYQNNIKNNIKNNSDLYDEDTIISRLYETNYLPFRKSNYNSKGNVNQSLNEQQQRKNKFNNYDKIKDQKQQKKKQKLNQCYPTYSYRNDEEIQRKIQLRIKEQLDKLDKLKNKQQNKQQNTTNNNLKYQQLPDYYLYSDEDNYSRNSFYNNKSQSNNYEKDNGQQQIQQYPQQKQFIQSNPSIFYPHPTNDYLLNKNKNKKPSSSSSSKSKSRQKKSHNKQKDLKQINSQSLQKIKSNILKRNSLSNLMISVTPYTTDKTIKNKLEGTYMLQKQQRGQMAKKIMLNSPQKYHRIKEIWKV